jgi:hypothetical protein
VGVLILILVHVVAIPKDVQKMAIPAPATIPASTLVFKIFISKWKEDFVPA